MMKLRILLLLCLLALAACGEDENQNLPDEPNCIVNISVRMVADQPELCRRSSWVNENIVGTYLRLKVYLPDTSYTREAQELLRRHHNYGRWCDQESPSIIVTAYGDSSCQHLLPFTAEVYATDSARTTERLLRTFTERDINPDSYYLENNCIYWDVPCCWDIDSTGLRTCD